MYIPRESPIMHVQHRQSKSKIEAIRAKFRAWSHANEKSNPKGKKNLLQPPAQFYPTIPWIIVDQKKKDIISC